MKSANIAINVNMGVKRDEEVLIVTDEYSYNVGYSLYLAAKSITKHTSLMIIYPRTRNGEEPDRHVAEAMKSSDVVLAPTKYSLTHTEARREATRNGTRIATLPGITEDTFIRAMDVDYYFIRNLSEKLAELLSNSKKAVIETKKGTAIELELGNPAEPDTGIYTEPGSYGNLPAGEAYLAPRNAFGKIFVDRWNKYKDLGFIEVENGFAVSMPDEIKSVFKKAEEVDGEGVYMIAEFGIGTNPGARVVGNVLEDEKVLGTVHIAFGSNASFPGGSNKVSIHEDFILLNPTVWLDGKKIMDDGRLLIEL